MEDQKTNYNDLFNKSIFNDKISTEPFPPSFEIPQSYNQLNTIMTYYSLPVCTENCPKFEFLKEIYKINEFLKIRNFDFDENILSEKLRLKERYENLERECDLKEVELASMSQTHFTNPVDIHELRKRHSTLKQYLADQAANKTIICKRRLEKIIKNKDYIQLGFLKAETKGLFLRNEVLSKIRDKIEKNDANISYYKVLYKVVENYSCRIEDLSSELNISRIELLRIIYSYSAKGIFEYNRLEDSVFIK